MNLFQIIQIPIGLFIALFFPGYLIARIFFNEIPELEKIALAFVLSIVLDILVGLFLGYNQTMKDLTGGITTLNLWIYLGSITIALVCVYVIVRKDEIDRLLHHLQKQN
jgi:uncharacterized membrane protein